MLLRGRMMNATAMLLVRVLLKMLMRELLLVLKLLLEELELMLILLGTDARREDRLRVVAMMLEMGHR